MAVAPFLVPVGGFLGAGKTSLILSASRVLHEHGFGAAAIFNDQGGNLVDTAFVAQHGIATDEVAGACFCCRFSELMAVADQLRALRPDVIFIEPVGSCTDLAATVMRPLLVEGDGRYRIAPLSVLVDPGRMASLSDASMSFLFEKQLAEADLVVFSKSDLQTGTPQLSGRAVRSLSARTGQGVQAWLDEVLSGAFSVGEQSLDIDYEAYAKAEAALGWLNWSGTVELDTALSPAELIGPWIDRLQEALDRRVSELAHLKVLDQVGGGYLKASVTSNDGEPCIEGDLGASPERLHAIRINLRAVIAPGELREVFTQELKRVPGTITATAFQCFSPAPPQPERRVSK